MARPRHEHPTPAELEVLQTIWDRGPSTVREVMEVLNPANPRAYTSIMSLMNVMVDKTLLVRKPRGRAFVYHARVKRDRTLGGMVRDLVSRAFDGSASAMVSHLLDGAGLTQDELDEIRKTIDEHADEGGTGGDTD